MVGKKILCFVAYYLPGYKSGGPVRSIFNMVEHLKNDVRFKIVTYDRDFLETKPYNNIHVNKWSQVGKADVYYVPPEDLTFKTLKNIFQNIEYDIVYLNSFFDKNFTIKPLLLLWLGLLPDKPVIIAPRGEFSQGAMTLKTFKKKIYLTIVKNLGICDNLIWHASSEHEADDIRRIMGKKADKIVIALNLPSIVSKSVMDDYNFVPANEKSFRIIFLSRISSKKNLDFALRVLSHVKVDVVFDIYGMVDDIPHWSLCEELIQKLPSNIRVKYKGSIPHQEVHSTLTNYDLFFLPTRGENYGHVIYEALFAGIPVLISDQTPWKDIAVHNVGYDLPLSNPQKFVEVIEWYAEVSLDKKKEIRMATQRYIHEFVESHTALDSNRKLFLNITDLGV